jgi:uncharacterized membrane protein (TIGR02234 family)
MIDRLTSKRVVLVLVLLSASVILLAGSREWVTGSVDDAVLGPTALHGRGSDIAPGALAAALVGLASAVAAATAGPVVRVFAACAALLAAVLGAAVVISVLADPSGALGAVAATGTGRGGAVAAHGRVGSWAWVALVATLVMGTGGLGALVGARRWRRLSSRYDAPAAGRMGQPDPAGAPAAAHESAWDQLSRGEDPTAGSSPREPR